MSRDACAQYTSTDAPPLLLYAVAHCQVQLLCEALDREWAVVFYWSEALGSHASFIRRDREFFTLLWQV